MPTRRSWRVSAYFVEMGLLMFVNRKIKGRWRRVVRLTDRGRLLVDVLGEVR